MVDVKCDVLPEVRCGWETVGPAVLEAERYDYEPTWLANHLMGDRPLLGSLRYD